MVPDWFVSANGKQVGPFTAVQLSDLAKNGRLRPVDMVRKLEGPWVAAENVRGLFGASPAPSFSWAMALGAACIVAISAGATTLLIRDDAPSRTAADIEPKVTPTDTSPSATVIKVASPLRSPKPVVASVSPTPTPTAVAVAHPANATPSATNRAASVAGPPAGAPAVSAKALASLAALREAAAQVHVQYRINTTDVSRKRSAIVLDASGRVLTFASGGPPDLRAAVQHAASGKSTPALGYAAAMPGKNMVLLKTEANLGASQVRFGAAPKIGDKIYAVAVRSEQGLEAVASGTVAELASGQAFGDALRLRRKSGFYDYDGRFFRVEFAPIPTELEYFFANEAGEIVGMFVYLDREQNAVWGVETSHVAELTALDVGETLPLSDLNRRSMRNGAVYLASQQGIPRGFPRPSGTMTAVGASTPSLSPASGTNVPASLGSTAATTSQTTAVAPTIDPNAPFHPAAWTSAMQALDERRRTLQLDREGTIAQLEGLMTELKQREVEYRQIDAQAVPLRQQYNALQARINDLSLVQQTSEVVNSILRYRSEQATLDSKYNQLTKPVPALQKRVAEINEQGGAARARLSDLQAKAVETRDSFLHLTRPLETPALERGKTAIEYFDNLTKSDSQPAFAYFGRGVGHMIQEKITEAIADFDRALTLAPDEPTFLAMRCLGHLRNGDNDKARADIAKSTSRDGKDAFTRYIYALLQCRMTALSAAETQLKESQKLDPTNPAATVLLSLLKATATDDSFRNGKFALVLTEKLPSDRWDCLLAKAAAQAESGDFKEAATLAEKAAAAAPARSKPWCDECLQLFRAAKPLRIDWKTFAVWKVL